MFAKWIQMYCEKVRVLVQMDVYWSVYSKMEFYRSSMLVLPVDIFAAVDVGAIYRSKGYLDFYINDKRNWAIELLRDGYWSEEHQRRFGRNGVYTPIKKIAKEWVIVDTWNCTMKLPEQEEHGTNDIYVLCAKDFDSVQLTFLIELKRTFDC